MQYNVEMFGVIFTKLICKCGNIEKIITEKALENFSIKNIDDGSIALICKKCNDVVYITK